MNIVKNIEQYSKENVFYCDSIKNNVMNNGNFIRILYSTDFCVLNGITLMLTLNEISCEKYYNKYKCSFNINTHKEIIYNLKRIEEELLESVAISDKVPQYKIYEQLRSGNIKFFIDSTEKINNNMFMIKISGIWEADSQYGLTYKFLKINHP